MEDRRLPITVGQGAGARVVTLDLPPFTLVGATTRDGPADHAAARPLRHPAPPRALRPGRPRADRAALGARSSTSRSSDAGAERSPRAAAARRASPTACSSACATTPRCASAGSIDRRRRRRRARRCSRSTTPASTASTASSCGRSARSSTGGPVGLSTLAVAVGEEQDTIEDVYEPYLLQRGPAEAHAAGPRGDAPRPSRTSGLEPPRRRADAPLLSLREPSSGTTAASLR